MAAVYIHQPPFFSTPHLYTVSPGSWERTGAEITWIMNNYYLKAKKVSFLFSLRHGQKSYIRNQICINSKKLWFE